MGGIALGWRWLTAGESHGPGLVGIVEGVPARMALAREDIDRDLERRQKGYGRGKRMAIEQDRVEVYGGIRHGYTLGSPVAFLVRNRDFSHWTEAMSPDPAPTHRIVTRPRPGHADLVGGLKYGHRDLRNVLERASARETTMRVALGAVARTFLAALDIRVVGHVISLGDVRAPDRIYMEEEFTRAEDSPVRVIDPASEAAMMAAIDRARAAGDTLGGQVEVCAFGLPAGLGSYVQWDRRLEADLASAMLSIQAFKGVEVGAGFRQSAEPGSAVHDEIFWTEGRGFYRESNRAGGLEGGVTTGMPLVVRAAMKPLSTLMKPLRSVDVESKDAYLAQVERSDVTAVPPAVVVAEAMMMHVLAAATLEKFGGDSLEEIRERVERWRETTRRF